MLLSPLLLLQKSKSKDKDRKERTRFGKFSAKENNNDNRSLLEPQPETRLFFKLSSQRVIKTACDVIASRKFYVQSEAALVSGEMRSRATALLDPAVTLSMT